MARQVVNNGEAGGSVRGKLNDNFAELYAFSGAKTVVNFSTAIPLNGNKSMPRQIVAGNIAFTVGEAPQAGAQCYVRLIADGAHTPTFTGFRESGASSGYNPTSGIDNQVYFWHDGIDAWYAVLQEVNAQPIQLSVLSGATVPNSTPNTISLAYSNPLNTFSVPDVSAYSVSASGGAVSVSGVAIANSTITLSLSRTLDGSETATVDYTVPGVNWAMNNASSVPVSALSGQSVVNNAPTNIPIISSAAIDNGATDHIILTYGVQLDTASIPATSAFSVSASGGAAAVSGVSIAGSAVTLALSRTIAAGETVTVSYTVPGTNRIKANAGAYYAAALVDYTVSNSQVSVLRYETRFNVTETADATFGYDYVGTTGDLFSCYGVSAIALPASADGWCRGVVGAIGSGYGPILGLKSGSANANYANFVYGIYADSPGYYRLVLNGVGMQEPDTQVTPAVGDLIRLRRAGTTVYAEVSKNGGSSWTITKTWTGDGGGALYACISCNTGVQLNQAAVSNGWA